MILYYLVGRKRSHISVFWNGNLFPWQYFALSKTSSVPHWGLSPKRLAKKHQKRCAGIQWLFCHRDYLAHLELPAKRLAGASDICAPLLCILACFFNYGPGCVSYSHEAAGQTSFMHICPSLYGTLLSNTKVATIATCGSQSAYGASERHNILPSPRRRSVQCFSVGWPK